MLGLDGETKQFHASSLVYLGTLEQDVVVLPRRTTTKPKKVSTAMNIFTSQDVLGDSPSQHSRGGLSLR